MVAKRFQVQIGGRSRHLRMLRPEGPQNEGLSCGFRQLRLAHVLGRMLHLAQIGAEQVSQWRIASATSAGPGVGSLLAKRKYKPLAKPTSLALLLSS
jgi:hypothetical protein